MSRKFLRIEKNIKNDIKNGKISRITQKFESITKDSVFVCIKGNMFDTNALIEQAFSKGAKYVFGSIDFNHKNYYKTSKPRKMLAYLNNIYYKYPDKYMDIIGVVGTNGKTSTTYIFKQFCDLMGLKCGVIGTNGIYIGDDYYESALTTPDSEELFYYLDKMHRENVRYVIMEVSAHSIILDKIFSINFSRLIFTNFSQDHLDYFGTIEKYRQTKESIFYNYNYTKVIINTDDKVGNKLYSMLDKTKLSYGENGDIKLVKYVLTNNYSDLKIMTNDEFDIRLPIISQYNIYNYLAVFTTFLSMGFSEKELIEHTQFLKNLKGRFQVIKFSETHRIIIDYAHTPKSTYETLKTVKYYFPDSYIITLFGCPGNREQEKRKITGRIVSEFSDMAIITSDNPNFENPIRIISQIKNGIKIPYKVIEDRTKAMKKAFEIFTTKNSSTLILMGKGIENYQIINGYKIPYNDEEEIMKLIQISNK